MENSRQSHLRAAPERLLRLHFLESFWLAEHFLADRSVLTDLGSGAGFPGLAARIYRPRLRVSLVEKNAKKVLFLEEVTRRLKLREVSIVSHSWEQYEGWKTGGIASIRALKVSPSLLERLAAHRQEILLLHTSELPPIWTKCMLSISYRFLDQDGGWPPNWVRGGVSILRGS